jgi:hypothetical protein
MPPLRFEAVIRDVGGYDARIVPLAAPESGGVQEILQLDTAAAELAWFVGGANFTGWAWTDACANGRLNLMVSSRSRRPRREFSSGPKREPLSFASSKPIVLAGHYQ